MSMSEDVISWTFRQVPSMNNEQLGIFMESVRNVMKYSAAALAALNPDDPQKSPYENDIPLLSRFPKKPTDFFNWKNRVQNSVMQASENWDDEQKVTFVFLHMTPDAYRNFAEVKLPDMHFLDCSYEELMEKIENWMITPSRLLELRYKLFTFKPNPEKSVLHYVRKMQTLARMSGLETADHESMIVFLILSNLNDPEHVDIRNALLTSIFMNPTKDLTYEDLEKEILDYSKFKLSIENTNQNTDSTSDSPPAREKNRRRSKQAPREEEYDDTQTCYRCNGSHHQSECRYKKSTCHYCGKVGHIRPACWSLQ